MQKDRLLLNLASFLTVAAIFLCFSVLAPLMADNFVYSRAITPGFAAFYTGSPVVMEPLSLKTAVAQACEIYTTWCGRFAGNLSVYLLFLLPRTLYCVLAALAFAVQVLLTQVCIFGADWRRRLSPGWIFGIAALLWLTIPSFGEAYFWLSVGGQLALLAQSAVFVPFRLALDREPPAGPGNFFKGAAFFLLGATACSLDFPTSAALPPTALAACLYLRCEKKLPLRRLLVLMAGTAGLCLGGALTLLSPGNAQRLLLTHDESVLAWLAAGWGERILGWFAHLPGSALTLWLPLLWLGLGLLALRKRFGRGWWRHFPVAALLFLLPALLTHAAYLFTAWPPPRAFATCAAQLVMAAAIVSNAALAAAGPLLRRRFALAARLVLLVALASVCIEAWKFWHLHEEVAVREAILARARGSVAELPPLRTRPDRWQPLGGSLNDISEDPGFWVNRGMAAWHGVEQVVLKKDEGPARRVCAGGPALLARAGEDPRYANLELALDRGRIQLRVPERSTPAFTGPISVYYDGYPGLVGRLPDWLAAPLRSLTGEGEGWRRYLALILFARADIRLAPGADGRLGGRSANLSLAGKDRIWLVNPDAGPLSPDLLPLQCGPVGNQSQGPRCAVLPSAAAAPTHGPGH